jgi:precorrin-6x reductase
VGWALLEETQRAARAAGVRRIFLATGAADVATFASTNVVDSA